jgi:PPM family protein phosphatase
MRIKSLSAESDQGPFLQINEDSYDFDLDNNLFMVLDGFGGVGIGDIAITKLKENIKKFYGQVAEDPDATLPFFFSPKYLLEGNALINSMLYSHNLLMKENMQKEISARAGASGVVMSKAESILTLASVGNCASYLYRKGIFKKIFIEDSFAFLSKNDYESHLKTMPLSGFGLFPDLYYQVKEVRLFEGDLIVLLTDGVYARLEEDEIKDIITNPRLEPKKKIAELFSMANGRGNIDNQTAMILEF